MTHEIVINGRFLSRRVTGVERYGREIIPLFRSSYQLEMTRLNGFAGHTWEQFALPAKLNSKSILWSPANTGPLLVRNQALTIHDLSPLEHPEWFQQSFALWYRLFLPALAKRVRIVFTPSEYMKQKATKRFGIKNVIVTPNGVDISKFHPCARPRTFELPNKYVLFVGSLQPRKNLHGLMKAWYEICHEFKDTWLLIAGATGHVFYKMKFPKVERVCFLNYVPDEELPGLYANAQLFVLPSFDEGFGLPVLEALACGAPVLVSIGGALPEVVADAGYIFDVSDPEALVSSLRQCLCEKDLRPALKEKGLARAQSFSWRNTANLIWKTLHEI